MASARVASVCLLALLALLALAATANAATDTGAGFFEKCARDDPKLGNCMNGAIQYAIRSLGGGYDKLGLPKLDPLNLAKVTLTDPRGVTCDLLNYDVDGLDEVVVQNSTVTFKDSNNFRLSFDAFLPQFNAAGSYKMERFFLDSPKPNEGQFTFNLTGYRVNFVLDGAVATGSDGKRYATLSGVSSDFYGGTNPHVYFNNNSAGRNRLWNKEPAAILHAYKVGIDAVHPTLAATYSNLIFSKIPFDDIFPPTMLSTSPQNYFKRCSRNDANLNQCLNNAIAYAIRSLKDGNTLLGLSKLDPLTLDKVTLKDSRGVTLDLLNYDVIGLKDVVCQNTSLTFSGDNAFRLSFDLLLPQFDAAGSYKMGRFFLDSPRANEGKFTFNLTEYRVNFVLGGAITTKSDNLRYATISGISSNFYGGTNSKVHFENNSVGRNRLWNRDPAPVLKAYKTAIDAIHPVLASTYSNILFSAVSFDDLLPATSAEANALLLTPMGVRTGVDLYSTYKTDLKFCD